MTKKKQTIPSTIKEGKNVAKTRTFVNSRGLKLTLHSVPPLLIPRIAESVPYPAKPTYSVTLETGDVEVYDHDETTLTTPEEKYAWKKYKEEYDDAEERLTNTILKAMLAEAVEMDISEEDLHKWEQRQKAIGLPVPEEEEEKILLYKELRAIANTDDIERIMSDIFELTGISEEELQLAKASFQNPVESKS